MYSIITNAADLTVQEFGAGGNYASINAAMTAAVDGDRIIVIPKAGNAPWVENLTVTKSLTFISDTENGKIKLTGYMRIMPLAALKITIIGVDMTGGIFSQTALGNSRTIVNIFNSFINGGIDFQCDNYYVTISATTAGNTYTRIRSGKLLGNNLGTIVITDEGAAAYPKISDSIIIIGNRITAGGIAGSTTKYSYFISNNYVEGIISLASLKGSSHSITNNTIYHQSGNGNNYGIIEIIGLDPGGNLLIMNNLIHGTNLSSTTTTCFKGIGISGIALVGFNYLNNGFDSYFNGLTDAGTNVTGFPFTLNTNTGAVLTGNLTDVGHPDATFTDLDLTRNDVGCYGGSFSMDNFFPANDNNARVYYLELPRRTGAGITTVPVKAEAFDK